jgi:hypothetical protein
MQLRRCEKWRAWLALYPGPLCSACTQAHQAAIAAAAMAAREAERRNEEEQFVTAKKEELRVRLERGERVYLFESVYVPVDSVLMEVPLASAFDIDALKRIGLSGRDIVAVVPRTQGIGLKNDSFGSTTGTTWGGGSGGNVVGVHVIVRKELTRPDEVVSGELLERFLRFNAKGLMASGR